VDHGGLSFDSGVGNGGQLGPEVIRGVKGGALLIGVEAVRMGEKGSMTTLIEMGRGPRPDRQAVNNGPAMMLVGG
jgi:hypothetical protein